MFWGKKIDGGLMHFCSFTTYIFHKGVQKPVMTFIQFENLEVNEVANEL